MWWPLERAVTSTLPSCVRSQDELIEKCKAAGVDKRVFKEAEAAKGKVESRKGFMRRLQVAMDEDEKDKDLIASLVEEAGTLGITGAKIDAAASILNRDKFLKEARKALKKAMRSADEKALAEALDKATSLGMSGEDVAKAKEFQKRLGEEKELASGVRAALKAVTVKAESKNGIGAADLEPLVAAMEEATARGLSDDSPFMQQAKAAQAKIEQVLDVQAEVGAALDSTSLRTMKKVLDKAEDLDLGNSSLVKKLRARLRELEKARSKAAVEDEVLVETEAVPSLDDAEMKRLREEKMRKAQNPKFAFTRFNKIRAPDDFVRGVLLTKKKVKAQQLRWQPTNIPTSILDYASKVFAKAACAIHKNILGYTGDRSMSFPATLAQVRGRRWGGGGGEPLHD